MSIFVDTHSNRDNLELTETYVDIQLVEWIAEKGLEGDAMKFSLDMGIPFHSHSGKVYSSNPRFLFYRVRSVKQCRTERLIRYFQRTCGNRNVESINKACLKM